MTESSEWVATVMGLEKPPNNKQAIWSQKPDQKKRECTILYLYVKPFKIIWKTGYADYPDFGLQTYVFLSSTKRPFYT